METPGHGERSTGLPLVNRSALLVEPANAYLEWAKTCPDAEPDLTLENVGGEGTVYLIPEMYPTPDTWLRRNFKTIFEHELAAWYTDDSIWPRDCSFKAFKRYFNVRFVSMVFDMGKGALQIEDG